MSDLKFSINAEEMAALFGDIKKEVETALTEGVKQLASMTHAKVSELANETLHTSRQTYLDNLDFEEIASGVWVVSLGEPALFVEDGIEAGPMHEKLLGKNSKISSEGYRYKVIPFKHSKPKSQQNPQAQKLVQQIKTELKKQNIPYQKLELNADGSPRIGKLHVLNIDSDKPSIRASHPALSGLTIYQRKNESGNVRRDIMTFRVISDKVKDKWISPGVEPRQLFEKAFDWAEKTWENEIMPDILNKYLK